MDPLHANPPMLLAAVIEAIRDSIESCGDAESGEAAGSPSSASQNGRLLCDRAIAAVEAHRIAKKAHEDLDAKALTAKKDAVDAYRSFTATAKQLFGKNILGCLNLIEPKPRATDAFISRAHAVFDKAIQLAEIREKLESAGYDEKRLFAEGAKTAAYGTTVRNLEAAKSAWKAATKRRDSALHELRTWLGPFLKTRSIEIPGSGELLGKLQNRGCEEANKPIPIALCPTAFVPSSAAVCPPAAATPSTTAGTSAL